MSVNANEKTSNVIQLPTSLTEKQLYDAESSIKIAQETKQEFCGEVLEFSMEQLFNCFRSFGVFSGDSARMNRKDIVLLEQSMESILFRYYGIPHRLHEIVDDMIQVAGEDDLENVDEADIIRSVDRFNDEN